MHQSILGRRIIACVLGALSLLGYQPTYAAENNAFSFRLAALSSFQVRNDIQIPNDNLGSRFSLKDAAGEGPVSSVRLEMNWMMNEKHGIRVLLAPLSYTKNVTFQQPVQFAGSTFGEQQPTEATYKFNSWRVGYHYQLRKNDVSSLRVGATLKVRDAEIRLEQAGTVSFKDDLGLVPLLYIAGRYRLNNQWTIGADLDGLAGGPGRAIDLGVAVDYTITNRWKLGAEVRVLDGGADADEVYNFAQFNSASIVLSTGF